MAEKSRKEQFAIYEVDKGDNLTKIATQYYQSDTHYYSSIGMSITELRDNIYALNREIIGDDIDLILIGSRFHIPISSQQDANNKETAVSPGNNPTQTKTDETQTQDGTQIETAVSPPQSFTQTAPDHIQIKIGSIIHLKSMVPDGGYLDSRGLVHFYPAFNRQRDRALGFVFTYGGDIEDSLIYSGANRDLKSGSWKIHSVDNKPIGDPLMVGDKILLENQYPYPYDNTQTQTMGYFNVIDNINDIEPFKEYAFPEASRWKNAKGIFTSRYTTSVGSNVWTLRSHTKKEGDPVHTLDEIWFESDSAGGGALEIYPREQVTENDHFKDWTGQQYFVFTNPEPNPESEISSWKIVLSHLSHNIFHVETKPNKFSVFWDSAGIFEVGGRTGHPIKIFNAISSDKGQSLTGKVTYFGEPEAHFKATLIRENIYEASISHDGGKTWQPDGKWRLGTFDKKIKQISIGSDDGGFSFQGTIRFEKYDIPLGFQGRKAKPQVEATIAPNQLPDHANSMRVVMNSTNRLIWEALITLLGSQKYPDLIDLLNINRAPGKHNSDLIKELENMVTPAPYVIGRSEESEYLLHAKQLIKLYILSQDLNHFLLEKLPTLIQKEQFHRVRKALRLAAADHEMLQRTALQRGWNKHEDGLYYISDHAKRVLLMDKLAMMSVIPFQKLLLNNPEQLRVITYFSTKTHIHHIPYDDRDGRFLLVGVSYDYDRVSPISKEFVETEDGKRDDRSLELMAIPHEVGHYIYRHAGLNPEDSYRELVQKKTNAKPDLGSEKTDKESVEQGLSSLLDSVSAYKLLEHPTPRLTFWELNDKLFQDNPYRHWCEEIFADMYSCVIVGLPSVLGMQAMLGATDRDQVWTDDEVHPTPVFRPYILTEMLRILSKLKLDRYPYTDTLLNELDRSWTNAIVDWGYERVDAGTVRPNLIQFRNIDIHAHIEEIVNVQKVIDHVRPILYTYARLLISRAEFNEGKNGDDGKLPTQIPWQHGKEEKNSLEAYYAEVEELANSYIVQKEVDDRVSSGFPIEGDDRPMKQTLQSYIDHWSDRGPLGHGDHPD